MTINVGDKLPSVTLRQVTPEGPKEVTTDEFFRGKKVALFAVPGAFTPACSQRHLPGFVEKSAEIKAKGIDEIACVAVNDAAVMGAWGKDQKCDGKVTMLSDGSGDFAKALGLELDLSRGARHPLKALFDAGRQWRRQIAQCRTATRPSRGLQRRGDFEGAGVSDTIAPTFPIRGRA